MFAVLKVLSITTCFPVPDETAYCVSFHAADNLKTLSDSTLKGNQMPINKIRSSGRARAAIAAVMAMATVGGYVLAPDGSRTSAAVVLASQTLVRPWEGRALRAYLDTVARPPILTICDGDTQNVRKGMVETPAGCDKRLQRRMTKEFEPALQECVDGFHDKPLSWQAMMLSLAWNIGTHAACKSKAAEYGRRGLYMASCVAATAFNKAGGRVIIGLVKRRENGDAQRIGEAELCVSGLPS